MKGTYSTRREHTRPPAAEGSAGRRIQRWIRAAGTLAPRATSARSVVLTLFDVFVVCRFRVDAYSDDSGEPPSRARVWRPAESRRHANAGRSGGFSLLARGLSSA